MSLAHLPNELLEAIAANLDSDSLMALGLMNRNFLNISLGMVGNLKPTIPKNATRDYLKSYGSSVRHLDLSASKIPPRNLTSLIMDCRNVTELDVIGKRISVCEIVRAVEELKNLEVLSFSVMTGICPEAKPVSASEGPAIQPPLCDAHDPLRGREFGHLKKLYIEIVGSGYMFDFVVKFMNRCTNVQAAHVNMVAQGSNVQSLTPMNPKRWNTLRSFVFTHFPPNRMFDHGVARFLARIFAHKLIFEFVRGWIQERKYCYIYENGHFNGNLSKIIASNEGSDLLEKVQALRLRPNEETFREPWGRPQKLRIMCEEGVSGFQVRSILSNAGDWSSTIVELDLTDSHFFDPEINTHFDLITLSPALEGIAVPTCFLDNRPAGGHHFGTSDCRSVELDVLDSRLKKLRLKKICLRTTPTCFDCINTDLTCCNMLNLRNLNQLEEVTLDGVVLEHSAYDFVANPNVRTLKLVLTSGSSFSCLPDLVKHCKKLEKLKLESDYPPLLCTDMWQSLVDCRSLKQLCLGSRDLIVEDVPWSRFDRKSIFRFISQIVTKLEVIHIHTWLTVGSDTSTTINLHDVVREIMMLNSNSKDLELIEERFVGPEQEAPHDIHPPENPPAFVGRDLCSSRSFIGKIEAKGRL